MEVLEVGFIERVTNDFDVKIVEILSREAVSEVRGCRGEGRVEGNDEPNVSQTNPSIMQLEPYRHSTDSARNLSPGDLKLTQGSLDQDALVEFLNVRRDAQRRHRIKDAQRMASIEQLARVSFMQCTEGKKNDVVNHVGIATVITKVSKNNESV